MAAPSQLDAIWKFVVITRQAGTSGVIGNLPVNEIEFGYVEQVGLNVTKVSLGQTVLYKTESSFSESETLWDIVHEDNIYAIINAAP